MLRKIKNILRFWPLRYCFAILRFFFRTPVVIVLSSIFFILAFYITTAWSGGSIGISFDTVTTIVPTLDVFFIFIAPWIYTVIGYGLIWYRLVLPIPSLPSVLILAAVGIAAYASEGRIGHFTLFYAPELWWIYLRWTFISSLVVAAVVRSFHYMLLPNPPPMLPSRRDIKRTLHNVKSYRSWQTNAAIVFLVLFILQTIAVVSLWLRFERIEDRLGGAKSFACNEKETIARVKESTVRIETSMGEGSGILVREDGVVLTNAHVIDGEPSPKVILPDYKLMAAEVVLVDNDADIAILKIDGVDYPTLGLGDVEELEPMEPLFVVGYPLGMDIKGDSTVASARFVSRRRMPKSPVSYIQLDGAINEGASGGPVVTTCGDVVGMATMGTPSLGLAIDAESLHDKTLILYEKELPRIEVVKLEPDKGPVEAVTAFYSYIKMRKFDKAYDLVSKVRLGGTPLETWAKGYEQTLDVTLVTVRPVEEKENYVFVKLRSIDLVYDEIAFRYFEGEWEVIDENGHKRLNESNIKEVKEPPWYWFWE
ncbi:serine protease [Patescibacteria group bacterium]|nr:serine protease [Patescibacteria group bacterium]MBU1472330.1 serine protease [Patescibacteria group bacterium]MBU2460418.1 serine protease [Patescibacteria group bacterium]MBU2544511.1 serine protease [Patescibacteria group bacterium]